MSGARDERRFERPRRVVVKVGSSSLCDPGGALDRAFVADLAGQVADVLGAGVEVVLVSSGAVAAGLEPLGLARRPTDMATLQASASVGQGMLVHTYREALAGHGYLCGQVLLTADDVVARERYLNARTTFERLLALRVLPIVNENDTIVTDELRFGDNDRLAALVASMLDARLLVLLSDIDGLLDDDPATGEGSVRRRVDDLAELAGRDFGGPGTAIGSGGMTSKLEAVRIARFSGAHTVIANARQPGIVRAVVDGLERGTWFPPSRRRPESRKLWIAFAPTPRGRIVVDPGAVRALTERGSSLLAAGVVDAVGEFQAGDAVEVVDPDGRPVARGLVAFPRADVLRLRGRSSGQIAAELGPDYSRAVIHRDGLVVVE